MPSLDIVDDTGEVVETHETASGIAATDDGSTIAYVDPDGVLWTQSDNGRISIHDGLSPNAYPTVVLCGEEDLDCAVWVNSGDGTTPPENISSHFRLTEVPDALSVGDATESRLVAVMNESHDEGSCGGVYDISSSSYVWEGCESYLYDFSPDDAHLTGTHAYLDGPGPGYITILDAATGEEVARLDPKAGYIGEAVWQDTGHVIVSVFEPEGWNVYRLGVDGVEGARARPEGRRGHPGVHPSRGQLTGQPSSTVASTDSISSGQPSFGPRRWTNSTETISPSWMRPNSS